MSGSFLRIPLMLLVIGTLLCAYTATVVAHARFIESTPSPDAVVTEKPGGVTILFGELLEREGSQIKVMASDGTQVDLSDSALLDTNYKGLWVSLPGDLWPDTYTVTWQNMSAEDGHPATGEFTFTYAPTAMDETLPLALVDSLDP